MTHRASLMSPHARLALLRIALRELAETDPDGPTRGIAQRRPGQHLTRTATVYRALGLAVSLGMHAGITADPGNPELLSAHIDLPDAGRVAWPLSAHTDGDDEPDGAVTAHRISRFNGGALHYATH